MARLYDIVTFDCYGTLIDWESGIITAFIEAAAAYGVTLTRDDVLANYSAIEPLVEAESYRSYRAVLNETARQVAARLGWQLAEGQAEFLANSLPEWKPFPDTNPTLERLDSAGYRLGILSNIDNDLLASTLCHFNVSFDLLITAQEVCSYKPAHGHFIEARERIGKGRWLHAAQSFFHDVMPARAMGIPVAWINRKNDIASGHDIPDFEFRSLTELANKLIPEEG